jgi:integrase/recombinase XerD
MPNDLVTGMPGKIAERHKATMPALITAAGPAAAFVWDEFFTAGIRNPHTRRAYTHAVRRFLAWANSQGCELSRLTPGMLGSYLDGLPGTIPTRKQHLAALRGFFDALVLRHVVILNPAASVRAERYTVVEGKTPEITIDHARTLLHSIRVAIETEVGQVPHVVGLRDRAVIGILIYTAARIGAVASLKRGSLAHDGMQWSLRFAEKGGKSREIPLRHDLQLMVLAYLDAAGLLAAGKDTPLFPSAIGKTRQLAATPATAGDLGRMVKRRMKDAGLPDRLSPHSFRVTAITDLLNQGVPLEDVQHLAGHSDARTTRLYDRRQKVVTRNVVERISV